MLNNLKVGVKIFVLIAILSLFMVNAATFGIVKMKYIESEFREITSKNMPLAVTIVRITALQLHQMLHFERVLQIGGNARHESLQEMVAEIKAIGRLIAKNNKNINAIASQGIRQSRSQYSRQEFEKILRGLETIQQDQAGITSIIYEALNLIVNNKRKQATILAAKLQGREDRIHNKLEELLEEIEQFTQVTITRVENDESAAIRWLFMLALSCLLIGVLLGFLIIRSITRPLNDMVSMGQHVASGDLSVKVVDNNRHDEMGMLLNSYDQMVDGLRKMTDAAQVVSAGDLTVHLEPRSSNDALGIALSEMVGNLKNQTTEIAESINVLASSSNEISASVSQISSSATETASAVTETATTVQQLRQTAELSSQKAKYVAESAQEAVKVSQAGAKSVDKTISGMVIIREQMESIAESIVQLSEQSQAIGDIISTVNDLAEQSNLLAVNASIEAAKAGEQGKGFAVVAMEVKNLAEQSKQATAQVQTILSDIQKATSTAVMATEQGTRAVEAGVQQSHKTGDSIRQLEQAVNEASQAVGQISASSNEQLVGVEQVTQAMESVKQASEQNVESMRQLESAAQDLQVVGESLKQLVGKYRLA